MESQSSLNIKCTAKGNKVLSNINLQNSINDFLELLSQELGIQKQAIVIKKGFPPKSIDLSNLNISLAEAGIKNKESLIVEVDDSKVQSIKPDQQQPTSSQSTINSLQNEEQELKDDIIIETKDGMFMYRRIIKADDSCLFNSICLALDDKTRNALQMRQLVSQAVQQNPIIYNEGILGKIPEEYSQWILREDSWGGSVEMLIFSEKFKCEIAAIDIVNSRYDIFGEGNNYQSRIYLIYTGIHYDLAAKNFQNNKSLDTEIRVFSPQDKQTLQDVMEIAKLLKSKKQFTDTSKFQLQCGVCFEGIQGQKEAQEHAIKTGHMNFAQMNQ